MAEKDLVKSLAGTFGAITQRVAEKRPEDAWMYRLRANYYDRLLHARELGMNIAWMNFGNAPELFHAMDIVPLSPESTTAILAGFPGGVLEYLDAGAARVADYICGANKVMIGAAIKGDLPRPDFIIHATQPCDSGLISFTALADYMQLPSFCVDVPYWNDDRSYNYLAGELRRLVSFLEARTGKRLDLDRLREVVNYSNQAQHYLNQINELRKRVPCPLGTRFLFLNSGVCISLFGTQELVDYCRQEYELARDKVARGEGHLAEEKLRLAWIYTPIFYDLGIFDWMEKEKGAIIVMDMMGHYRGEPVDTTSEETIFQGLARRVTSLPMGHQSRGPMEYYSQWAVDLCRDYQADAAIYAGNMACKHGWAIAKLIKDIVLDRVGVPTLVFDLDIFDPRVCSPDTIKARLDDFFATVA